MTLHIFDKPSKDWIEDSTRWRGKVLCGPYAHWCAEWDELPTDLFCREITCCSCYSSRWFRICRWFVQQWDFFQQWRYSA